jgi:hypothetical protein
MGVFIKMKIGKFMLWVLAGILISKIAIAGRDGPGPPEFTFSDPVHVEGLAAGYDVGFNVRIFADPILAGAIMSHTNIHWEVKKPGVYATNGIVLIVVTSMDTQISFSGVEDLGLLGEGEPSTWYAFSETESYMPEEGSDVLAGEEEIGNFALDWKSADELNGTTLTITPPPNEITTKSYYVWNKIKADVHTQHGSYEDPDGFVITITFLE